MNHREHIAAIMLCLALATAGQPAVVEPASAPPDLTQGGGRDQTHDWCLGPTGMRGWIFTRKGQSSEARQILVTDVAKGSPADGSLATGDVIIGVDGRPFADDARIRYAKAITAAEEERSGGRLRLIRWRAGASENIELKLPVVGTYSDTAPYDCPKSRRIFEQGCRRIANQGLHDAGIPADLNALALLASGTEDYRPLLAAYAKKVAASLHPDVWTWFYGYGNLFLAEYVLATGDRSILPELARTTKESLVGQSAVGTWGHEFYARPSGNLNGYGCMNAPGIVLLQGLVLAREAGVKDPAVDQAIAKGSLFLRWYVNKGAIPYGDHQPWPGHEDNGKCSAVTVLFDLLGDREATAFFARMSTAGYDERERGHTGNFFNILWALPGVSRCGPLATGAYLKEQGWYYDLNRGWDGGFAYQGSPAGEEEHHKYTNWDCTGAYLLAYALPLKSLYLTGKKPCSAPALSAKEVEGVIAAGRDYFSSKNGYQGRTVPQLLAGLSSWSPAMRKRSAQALGRCEGDLVPTLLTLLAGSERDARYGACEALGCMGPRADAAAPQLRALLHDPDPWLQSLACSAVMSLSPEVRTASVNDLLALAAGRTADDPRGMTQRAVAAALFEPNPDLSHPGILQLSLAGVDRRLLYPAMASLLQNDDALARYGLARYLKKLNEQDLAAMLPAIVTAIETMAPSDEMFGDGIRLAGLDLLAGLRIREGLPLCLSVLELDRWGSERRVAGCLKALRQYGVHAKEVLPQLRDMSRRAGGKNTALDKLIADIETLTDAPPLIALKDFIARASAQGEASSGPRR